MSDDAMLFLCKLSLQHLPPVYEDGACLCWCHHWPLQSSWHGRQGNGSSYALCFSYLWSSADALGFKQFHERMPCWHCLFLVPSMTSLKFVHKPDIASAQPHPAPPSPQFSHHSFLLVRLTLFRILLSLPKPHFFFLFFLCVCAVEQLLFCCFLLKKILLGKLVEDYMCLHLASHRTQQAEHTNQPQAI